MNDHSTAPLLGSLFVPPIKSTSATDDADLSFLGPEELEIDTITSPNTVCDFELLRQLDDDASASMDMNVDIEFDNDSGCTSDPPMLDAAPKSANTKVQVPKSKMNSTASAAPELVQSHKKPSKKHKYRANHSRLEVEQTKARAISNNIARSDSAVKEIEERILQDRQGKLDAEHNRAVALVHRAHGLQQYCSRESAKEIQVCLRLAVSMVANSVGGSCKEREIQLVGDAICIIIKVAVGLGDESMIQEGICWFKSLAATVEKLNRDQCQLTHRMDVNSALIIAALSCGDALLICADSDIYYRAQNFSTRAQECCELACEVASNQNPHHEELQRIIERINEVASIRNECRNFIDIEAVMITSILSDDDAPCNEWNSTMQQDLTSMIAYMRDNTPLHSKVKMVRRRIQNLISVLRQENDKAMKRVEAKSATNAQKHQSRGASTIAARLKAKHAAKKEQGTVCNNIQSAESEASASVAAEKCSHELIEALQMAEASRAQAEEVARMKCIASAKTREKRQEAKNLAKLTREKAKHKLAAKAASDAAIVAFNAATAARSAYYCCNYATKRSFKAHTMWLTAVAVRIQRAFRKMRASRAAAIIQHKFRTVQRTKLKYATEKAYCQTVSHLDEVKTLLRQKPFDSYAARNLLKRLYEDAIFTYHAS